MNLSTIRLTLVGLGAAACLACAAALPAWSAPLPDAPPGLGPVLDREPASPDPPPPPPPPPPKSVGAT